VLAVRADGREITIHHDDVKGFMPAMTMPFQLKDPALAKGRMPGDMVKATLVVTDNEAWLSRVVKIGWAPFPEPSAAAAPPAIDLLRNGDEVPDETLIDQSGTAFQFSSLRGSAVLVTFIYTRCPMPDFCPRMDALFAAVQRAIQAGRVPGKVRLLSVSFDPDFDAPAVLKAHAAAMGADERVWTFATAPRAQIEQWGARLGLSVLRAAGDPSDITHNLRTAVIDRRGRLVTVLGGNQWTAEQAIAALASVPAS
jgi:protein SCO1/2